MRENCQSFDYNSDTSFKARVAPSITNDFYFQRKSENLQSLPENQLLKAFRKFLPFFEAVRFAENTSIYQPGDPVDYVYFPQSSVFSEFQILENGATVEIAMTGSEGIIGLTSVFNEGWATNWTQVSVAGKALKIKSKILREEIGTNPDIQKFLFDCVNNYIGQISQRAVCNICHTLEKRFCSWLLMLQDRLKLARLPLTQEQLARILGVHRPSITNIAKELREAGVINYRRGVIFIRDRRQLESRACRCYAEIDKNFDLY